MVVLYHYTNEKAARSIQRSGILKQSTDSERDAAFGNGVYLTSIRPGLKFIEQMDLSGYRVTTAKMEPM